MKIKSLPLLKQHSLNRIFARLILESLYRSGVRHFCIAPGSRSTPLTLEAKRIATCYKGVFLHTHFDERGLGFLALGLSKAKAFTPQPIAIIVTSGSAVANLLPAFVEAGLTKEPLILLSADRPFELIDCGANQAINQKELMGSHVSTFIDLPPPSSSVSLHWLLTVMDETLARQSQDKGALHINCPFPEPLYGDDENLEPYLAPLTKWLNAKTPYLDCIYPKPDISPFLADWSSLVAQKGLLLVGQVDTNARVEIERLATYLGWPLLVDPQGGKSSDYAGYALWLTHPKAQMLLAKANCVIQFGARFVSKRLTAFLNQFNGAYYLVSPLKGRLDPHHLSAKRLLVPCGDFAACLADKIANEKAFDPVLYFGWGEALKKLSEAFFTKLALYFSQEQTLSEVGFAFDLTNILSNELDLFIGNSLIIRLIDMYTLIPQLSVYANRGASGIDGLIATAAGVQRANSRPLLCLLGDTSTLYDLNSLSLLQTVDRPFVLVVINNNGGGIFDLLAVPSESKQQFYQMPHGLHFESAAALFNLAYKAPKTREQASLIIRKALTTPYATLIELKVAEGQACKDIQALSKLAEGILF